MKNRPGLECKNLAWRNWDLDTELRETQLASHPVTQRNHPSPAPHVVVPIHVGDFTRAVFHSDGGEVPKIEVGTFCEFFGKLSLVILLDPKNNTRCEIGQSIKKVSVLIHQGYSPRNPLPTELINMVS